jgi:hypothetical protein
VPFICQGVSTGMSGHVRIYLQAQLGFPAFPPNHARQTSNGERCAAEN